MLKKAGQLLREPTLQFLVLAGVLFGIHALFDSGQEAERIVVSQAQIESLRQGFVSDWAREPTDRELQELVEDQVREEVYYREARALGLDRDDPVIRRHLRLKMALFAESLDVPAPTEAELADFLARHPEAFRQQDRITFEQVFLNSGRGESLVADVKAMAEQLSALPDLVDAGQGDEFFVGNRLDRANRAEVGRLFGQAFAERVFNLPRESWHGPIASPYGLHFVRVHERLTGEVPPLEAIRDRLEQQWRAAHLQQRREDHYRQLRAHYDVVIESPTGNLSEAGAAAE